jgi:predicted aminopeptidase
MLRIVPSLTALWQIPKPTSNPRFSIRIKSAGIFVLLVSSFVLFVVNSPAPLVKAVRIYKLHRLFPAIILGAAISGCSTLSYYSQAVHGEYEILAHRQSIDKLIANPKTPAKLKQQLQLVQQLRTFAKTELKLPVDKNYDKYADIHRRSVVWDVQAAPEFSLEPKTWHYPFVGSLAYRGYFSEKSARECGDRLAKQGFDVYVDGVDAYSTLGWFKDPLLNTFINTSEPELAELLFHELGHKRVFAGGDTDFNEAFATTVGQEGTRRWLQSKCETNLLDTYNEALKRDDQFVHLVMSTRERLGKLYAKSSTMQPGELRRQKQEVYDELRAFSDCCNRTAVTLKSFMPRRSGSQKYLQRSATRSSALSQKRTRTRCP